MPEGAVGDASEVAEFIQVTCWIGKAADQGRHTGLAWRPAPRPSCCRPRGPADYTVLPTPPPGGKGGRVEGQDLECMTELVACEAV